MNWFTAANFFDVDWAVVLNERTHLLIHVVSRVVVFVRREEHHVFLA